MEKQTQTQTQIINSVLETRTLEGDYPVYENASVDLIPLSPDCVYPTALYVLQSHLDNVWCIYERLLNSGINIFQLDGIVEFEGGIIAPPVVELSDGVPAIVDGIHRFYIARQLGFEVNSLYIERASMPIISYPVGWNEVVLYDKKPEEARLLRKLRSGIEDKSEVLKTYYRDFSFLGSNGRRARKGQNG